MKKTYLTVFGTLAVLTLLTVGVSYLHLNRAGAITVALLVAGIKVSLIAAFFMHLKFEKKVIHGIFYTALFFVLILLFLIFPDIGLSQ
ncbi:MAG: cytochrome C oxidase subunit IV family protein [Elusimicrobia bacterium]|nr:cytochrome C oxidase subunit IV family protein [Elusimicrobiota bacterium]